MALKSLDIVISCLDQAVSIGVRIWDDRSSDSSFWSATILRLTIDRAWICRAVSMAMVIATVFALWFSSNEHCEVKHHSGVNMGGESALAMIT